MLDGVRGVAILQVLVWHYFAPLLDESGFRGASLLGMTWTGVDLFFCLSGFLIGGIVIDQRKSSNFYQVFYARRALRILPLYLLLVLGDVLLTRSLDGGWAYATFTQNFWWAAQGHWGPTGTVVTWSLAVEEQFYLILPILIRLCPPRRLTLVLAGLICAAPALRGLAVATYGNRFCAYLLFPCRMDALLIGVVAAWVIRQPGLVRKLQSLRSAQTVLLLVLWCGFGSLLLGRYSMFSRVMQSVGYSWIALTYGATLLCIVLRTEYTETSTKWLPLFPSAGLGAYSIYLFHLPMLVILDHFYQSKLPTRLGAVALVFVLATVSWRFIEMPLIEFGRRRFRYQRLQ